MNKALFGALVASTFGLGALSAIAAELTTEERAELRARAERLQSERAARPVAVSDVDLNRNPSDVKLKQRGEIKQNVTKTKKIKKSKRNRNLKESVRKIPGALVRR